MKLINRFFIVFLLIAVCTVSCKKDDIGGTATQELSGEWFVTADALNADGSLIEKDIYGIGHFLVGTYNVSGNTSDAIFIDDYENFWAFKGKVNADLGTATFSGSDVENEYPTDLDPDPDVEDLIYVPFTVTNGKILKGAATTPSGMPADSIVFEVKFDDDTSFDRYRITGYRYTGFVDDEDH